MRNFSKKYNEQVRVEKTTLNQPPTERITNLTRGRPLMVGPVVDEKMRKFLMALFKNSGHISYGITSTTTNVCSAEVKICPLKTLKQHQCWDVVSSKDLHFEGELQQREKWKSLKEQEKNQGSSTISELLTS